MPKFPHWYVNRLRLTEDEDPFFQELATFVDKEGYAKRFFRKTLIYYDVGEWTLWSMGWPIADRVTTMENKNDFTWILNIAHINGLGPGLADPNKGISPICKDPRNRDPKEWW